MNIIIDTDTFTALSDYKVFDVEFGSALWGTKNEQSDSDILRIIEPSKMWLSAPYNTDHLLQYKDEVNNIDYIFCTPQTFIRGIVNGDSAIFHEILRLGGLKHTQLSFLEKIDFSTYKILRAYLGLAKRDIKETTKLWKDPRKSAKKLRFAAENVIYVAKELGFEIYVPDYTYPDTIQQLQVLQGQINSEITRVREELTRRLEANEIPRTITADDFAWIDYELDVRFPPAYSYKDGLDYFRESYINGN